MGLPVYSMNQNDDFYNENLSKYLQDSLSENGYVQPPKTSAEIDDVSTDMPNGTTWYDTDRNKFVMKENGSLVTVNTTPV